MYLQPNSETFVKKKFFYLLLKIGIGVLSFWVIYSKLNEPESKENFKILIQQFSDLSNLIFFSFIVLLLFLNWGIESKKWQLLVQETQTISFLTALSSVFAGICVGNLTPGRAGEFIGKIFFFKPEVRGKITFLHFVNGLTQLMITSVGGIVAILFWLIKDFSQVGAHGIVLILSALFTLVLFLLYFNIDFVIRKVSSFKLFSSLNLVDLKIERKILNKLLALSLLRYAVFCFQYISLLLILGVNTPFSKLILPVMISFLLTSAIPMISFIEAAIRSAIALLVFEGLIENSVLLITAATLIWVINIVIPSVIGYVILFRRKFEFKRSDG